MDFSNEAEAKLALISLVLATDRVCTESERAFVFGKVLQQEPFMHIDREEFRSMLTKVNEQLFGTPEVFPGLMQRSGVRAFSAAFKAVVPNGDHIPALQLACEMACADGLLNIERELLISIGEDLNISSTAVVLMMQEAELVSASEHLSECTQSFCKYNCPSCCVVSSYMPVTSCAGN